MKEYERCPRQFELKDSGKREEHATGAVRDSREGKGRFDLISPYALRRLAAIYEAGAEKYNDRNWEKGWKFSRCIDSAFRHLTQYMMGKTDEDHLAQAAWNLVALLHFEQTHPELDDLAHYEELEAPVLHNYYADPFGVVAIEDLKPGQIITEHVYQPGEIIYHDKELAPCGDVIYTEGRIPHGATLLQTPSRKCEWVKEFEAPDIDKLPILTPMDEIIEAMSPKPIEIKPLDFGMPEGPGGAWVKPERVEIRPIELDDPTGDWLDFVERDFNNRGILKRVTERNEEEENKTDTWVNRQFRLVNEDFTKRPAWMKRRRRR